MISFLKKSIVATTVLASVDLECNQSSGRESSEFAKLTASNVTGLSAIRILAST